MSGWWCTPCLPRYCVNTSSSAVLQPPLQVCVPWECILTNVLLESSPLPYTENCTASLLDHLSFFRTSYLYNFTGSSLTWSNDLEMVTITRYSGLTDTICTAHNTQHLPAYLHQLVLLLLVNANSEPNGSHYCSEQESVWTERTLTAMFVEMVDGSRPRLSNAKAVKTGDTLLWSSLRSWLR